MVVSEVLPNLGDGTVSAPSSANLCVQHKVEGQEEYCEKKSEREDANRPDYDSDFWDKRHLEIVHTKKHLIGTESETFTFLLLVRKGTANHC
jgi:hypothetical protein